MAYTGVNYVEFSEIVIPTALGVYQVRTMGKKIVYVGRAKNLTQRFLHHLSAREGNDCLLKILNSELHCAFHYRRMVDLDRVIVEEIRLIKKYRPICNKQHI